MVKTNDDHGNSNGGGEGHGLANKGVESGHGSTANATDTTPETVTALQLAWTILDYISPKARARRREVMRGLARKLGCQMDNADNQCEHLESLLLSHLGRGPS